MKILKELYESKLKYNCSFTTLKHNNNDLLLVYIGTDEFMIVSNYSEVVAIGSYRYDWDKEEAFIKYEVIRDHYNMGTLNRIILKYERKIMKLNCKINIERV